MTEWIDFLQEVREAERALENPREPWYRGHSNVDWQLTPSLLRHDEWQRKEKELFTEFTQSASRLFEKRSNDWETLFDMQHYWIPTRLLDWSTVLGVAIAFILHSDNEAEDSALFVLNPERLNHESGRELINLPEERTFDYKKIYWENNPVMIEKPIAVRPPHQSERLRAQKGVFTVHGSIPNGFEARVPECFKKVTLPAAAKPDAREFLKWANLDEYTIYPDIVGMARHITKKIL